MAYTTIQTIEARLGKTFGVAEAGMITSTLIPAIDKTIDNYCGRTFVEGSETDAWYYGTGKRNLVLEHEYTTLTSIKGYDRYSVEQETIDLVNDCDVLPFNTEYKNEIKLLEGLWLDYKYKVTGKKGYCKTCPADITLVATELCVGVLKLKGGVYSESIEGYTYSIAVTLANVIKENDLVRGILETYKRVLV